MTAMTAINPATRCKPPVPYTDAAIKAGIAHEAANGPSHVRIKALGMMARVNGLFELGTQLAKQLASQLAQELAQRAERDMQSQREPLGPLAQALADGVDLTDFSMYATQEDSETDDEEADRQEDDDVP